MNLETTSLDAIRCPERADVARVGLKLHVSDVRRYVPCPYEPYLPADDRALQPRLSRLAGVDCGWG